MRISQKCTLVLRTRERLASVLSCPAFDVKALVGLLGVSRGQTFPLYWRTVLPLYFWSQRL